ncbi:hypothetical protein ACFFKE_15610 [Streptomyces mutabilis]|uniref:hypothetical protein n=1 Tax=Streptomyces mutabilis TaxID=67332 RepID=UPI0017833707|nr:hypothetical protein [Streptomyces mutabilis]
MSEESVPRQDGADTRPHGLLRQMQELMAALNADLSALDAGLQSAGPGGAGRRGAARRLGLYAGASGGCRV